MTSDELRKTWNKVKTWRDRGIQSKWGKSHGRPFMFIHHGQTWWMLDKSALETICKNLDRGETLAGAVVSWLLLADIFSIPA